MKDAILGLNRKPSFRARIERVKEQIPILEYAEEHLVIEDNNYPLKVLCCFHDEKTPSLCIYENGYHCFGCGEQGDVISLHAELNDMDFIEALKSLESLI